MAPALVKPSLPWLVFCIALSLASAPPARSAAQSEPVLLHVDSPAVQFSPGNWAGDAGRGGKLFRRSWCNGAYCVWNWSTTNPAPTANLLASNQTKGSSISYFLDGHLVDNVPVPASGGIPLAGLAGPGKHVLKVYLRHSDQQDRWEGANACKIEGLVLNNGDSPQVASRENAPWALIIGDSITEGIGAHFDGSSSSLSDYAFLLGQGLAQQDMEVGVSACGYSGWIRPGDATADVPPYYSIINSHNGSGGAYNGAKSRWNKIDARTGLLDARGHLSAHGGTGQEPAMILVNYGTNETLSSSSVGDMQASMTQCLGALRTAAPSAWICVLLPVGLENTVVYPHAAPYLSALKSGVKAYRMGHRKDDHIFVVDLGPSAANALASPLYGGGVHPNAAGHAYVASRLLPVLTAHLEKKRVEP